jgi:hypothetical protein
MLKRTWIHNIETRKLTYVYMMHAGESHHFYVLILKITSLKLLFFLPFLHTSGIILIIVQSIKVIYIFINLP